MRPEVERPPPIALGTSGVPLPHLGDLEVVEQVDVRAGYLAVPGVGTASRDRRDPGRIDPAFGREPVEEWNPVEKLLLDPACPRTRDDRSVAGRELLQFAESRVAAARIRTAASHLRRRPGAPRGPAPRSRRHPV